MNRSLKVEKKEIHVEEVTMFDFEVRMRKTMSDFMNPAIERMAKDRDFIKIM